MGSKAGDIRVVEAIRDFAAGAYNVSAGARLWAWKGADGWRVVFNGADLPVPDGTVGEPDSAQVKQAAEERRSAREEEYQSAPTPSKA